MMLNRRLTRRNRSEQITGYLFILPQFLFFDVFLIYPVFEGFRLSLFNVSYNKESFVGLQNYINLFQDDIFLKAVWNTLWFVFWVTLITVIVGFIIACAIFDKKDHYVTFIRASYYIPTIISMVVVATIWKWMLNPSFGVITYILDTLGLSEVNLLGDANTVFGVLVLVLCTMNIGQAVLLYVANMRSIDVSLLESSEIDGASRLQRIRYLIYPLVRPTTMYLMIMNIINIMKIFIIINVMTSGGPYYATTTLMYLCYLEAFKSFNFGSASAIGVIMFLFTFLLSAVQFKLFQRKD